MAEVGAPLGFETSGHCYFGNPYIKYDDAAFGAARLLQSVNAAGPVLVSHTQLNDRYVMRIAIGNLRTQERHIAGAWELIREKHRQMLGGSSMR